MSGHFGDGTLASIRDLARSKASEAKLRAKAVCDRSTKEAVDIENTAKQSAKVILASLPAESAAFQAKIALEDAADSGPLTHELWSLQSVVNPARHLIKAERAKMWLKSDQLRRKVDKAREELESAKVEAARYAAITHAGLVRHAFS